MRRWLRRPVEPAPPAPPTLDVVGAQILEEMNGWVEAARVEAVLAAAWWPGHPPDPRWRIELAYAEDDLDHRPIIAMDPSLCVALAEARQWLDIHRDETGVFRLAEMQRMAKATGAGRL